MSVFSSIDCYGRLFVCVDIDVCVLQHRLLWMVVCVCGH